MNESSDAYLRFYPQEILCSPFQRFQIKTKSIFLFMNETLSYNLSDSGDKHVWNKVNRVVRYYYYYILLYFDLSMFWIFLCAIVKIPHRFKHLHPHQKNVNAKSNADNHADVNVA